MNLAATLAALASATGFAVSTSLQHHAAGSAPDSGVAAFVRHLLSRRTWLTGQVLALLSFGLHALALRLGPIAQVQPIVISGVVLAVPARAMMSRQLPQRRELVAVVVTTVGLGVFLVASAPSEGHRTAGGWTAFLVTAVGMAAVATLLVWDRWVHDPRRRAGLLGATAGVCFGLVAGLVKVVIEQVGADGLGGVLFGWPLWLLLLAGATGIVSNQRAYRVAALSASLPVLNIVDVLVALVVGLVVFDEVPAHSPTALALEALAMVSAAVGLRGLGRVEDEVDERREQDPPDGLDTPGGEDDPVRRHP